MKQSVRALCMMIVILALAHANVYSQFTSGISSVAPKPKFKALVLTERGGPHEGFVVAALEWLTTFAIEQQFEFNVINRADSINEKYLSQYQVFIQLNFPPYTWSKE